MDYFTMFDEITKGKITEKNGIINYMPVISEEQFIEYVSQLSGIDKGRLKLKNAPKSHTFSENGIIVKTSRDGFSGTAEHYVPLATQEAVEKFLENPEKYISGNLQPIAHTKGIITHKDLYTSNNQSIQTIQKFCDTEFAKLTSEQQSSLVAYKSSLFTIMNALWQRYGSADKVDLAKVEEIISTDYSKLIKKVSYYMSYYMSEQEKQEIMAHNAPLKKERALQSTIIDRFAYFRKALKNPNNEAFFETYFKDYDFSTPFSFAKSIVNSMKAMEEIEVQAPEDLTLYRGICGTAHPQKLSKSIVASCTPDLRTAKNASVNMGPDGCYEDRSRSVFKLNVQKGAFIYPLMFSVRSNMKTLTPEDVENGVKWAELSDDEITLSLEPCQQPEIAINTAKCNIQSIDENIPQEVLDSYFYTHITRSFFSHMDVDDLSTTEKLSLEIAFHKLDEMFSSTQYHPYITQSNKPKESIAYYELDVLPSLSNSLSKASSNEPTT